MSVAPLTEDEILERKRALEARVLNGEAERDDALAARTSSYKYVHPFSQTTDTLLEALESSDDRFRLGLSEIDVLTRGFGAKELILVTGFSHAGKTQLINTAILNNSGKRILFLSLDDAAEMILLKLACMAEGVTAQELEQRVRQHDESAKQILRQVASRKFGNLICIDDSLSLDQIQKAVAEATDYWGAPPEAIIIDYLGSIAGIGADDEDGGVKNKAAALKRWAKSTPCPVIVVHQQTRSRGAPGAAVTITSGAFGGEQEATILIGVRRKRDDESLDPWERDHHANTVTVHVPKCKRAGGKITPREGIDFYMDPDTGLIRSLRDTDRLHMHAIAREHAAAQ